jgi:hypothetical protein
MMNILGITVADGTSRCKFAEDGDMLYWNGHPA